MVIPSNPAATVNADACRRRGEVIVDPPHDSAALLSFTLAQSRYDVPFTPSENGEEALRRRSVRFEAEIVAIEPNLDAVSPCQLKCLTDSHSRTLHARVFFSRAAAGSPRLTA